MKQDIHPKYHSDAKVRCSCGAEFLIGSTDPDHKVEICSKCHPLYTGNKKLVDTAGRVDRFMARLKKSEEMIKVSKERSQAKKEVASKEKSESDESEKKTEN